MEKIAEEMARRVWVTSVEPSVDGGAFAVKRSAGEKVRVTAKVFADGHDSLSAVLRWRPASADEWREIAMIPEPNDSWRAEFTVETTEPHFYTVAGWIDRFATWRHWLHRKHEAGQDVQSELLEGAELIREAADRAEGPEREWLQGEAKALESAHPQPGRVKRALAERLAATMGRNADRSRQTVFDRTLQVDVARPLARFGAWYEMFPRSCGPDPTRSGTFRDAEARLPEIGSMGFDVLYLPPIHPIGKTHRKGPNNTLKAGPGDPGSPWAIGSREGGHTAVHPELGTLEDFGHFLQSAREHGLEVALDIAYQCSPDHPWVREHPEWFRHRPDGTIKYAENPPKKYQDIYPLDFETEQWRELWHALRDVVLFWIEQGVRVFRVDNPHTKSLRFWGWLISTVKRDFPDAIFLSEAFTRPAVMYTLAKLGFDQSYTYFTWRNTKHELTEYMIELTATKVREFFRPNFFANTPDILPEYLQHGGRPAFQARLVLAATLAASYGIYSGYELCEGDALEGREEYLDSEKFQIRHRDWNKPGNLTQYISRINSIRKENPALSFNERLRFVEVDNEQLIAYLKTTPDLDNIVLVVVNLDPHHAHDGWLQLPLQELGIEEEDSFQAHDLIGDGRYLWQGPRNYVRLDPQASPAHVLRLRRKLRTERDFDYFA